MNPSQGVDNDMTRPYSLAFKQKMVERLTGKDALSASQLARETGLRQQSLSRRLEEARSLPLVASDDIKLREWTVEQKARQRNDDGLQGFSVWLRARRFPVASPRATRSAPSPGV
jgi:hypothetical protein